MITVRFLENSGLVNHYEVLRDGVAVGSVGVHMLDIKGSGELWADNIALDFARRDFEAAYIGTLGVAA
jgi:hypothetical protein